VPGCSIARQNRNAAYLCEQAAEKLIRAVLTSEGIQAGIRHELPDMVAKIPDENPVKPATTRPRLRIRIGVDADRACSRRGPVLIDRLDAD
jgi:HEPN domain-containing protein